MKVLIVDDSINKFNDVSESIIKGREAKLEVHSVDDVKSAMEFISEHEVDLLIVDQQIPMSSKVSQEVELDGGGKLISEIERKKERINVPRYIVGLTQFPENESAFSDIWQKLIYSPGKTDWSNSLNKILSHVEQVSKRAEESSNLDSKLNRIYLEGKTDLQYLQKVLELHPDLSGEFELFSMQNAGANWVGQQLIIWGHSLPKDENGNHLTSIGIFDNDEAGILASTETKKKLSTANQQKYAKLYTIEAALSNEVLEFYKLGLSIEIEIESLLPLTILKHAETQGWLEHRTPVFTKLPNEWDQMNETIPEFLARKGVNNDQLLYLKKVKISKKRDFANYVINQSTIDKSILDNMKDLLVSVIEKL